MNALPSKDRARCNQRKKSEEEPKVDDKANLMNRSKKVIANWKAVPASEV
jgi:hypothetical protein